MPRRMARRSRGAGKIRYAWHGFYMAGANAPADILLDVFKLYDPVDADHQEEVVLQRIVGNIQIENPATAGEGRIAFGFYLASRDAAGAMTSDIDPLAITAFDIEANWTLYRKAFYLPPAIAGQQPLQYVFDFNIKAKRKVEDPRMVVMAIRGDTASRWKYMFQSRCLVKEGRF